MSWYYIHNSNKTTILSTNPTLSKTAYSFNVEINGTDCGTCNEQYKSNATTISGFRYIKQRLVFGNTDFNNVSIWCHTRSNSPSGTISTWVDVTGQFTIKTFPSTGIIDLQATNAFTYSSSYVYLYIAIDEDFTTKKYTITNNNTNCVCNSEIKPEYEKNENITLEFTANEGYAFNNDSISLTTGSLNNTNVIYSDDRKRITLSGDIIDNLTINVTANKVYTVSITGTFNNCTCNYKNGEIVDINKPVVISANSGYDFKGSYTYKKGVITHPFTKNKDDTQLYIETDSFTDNDDYYINDNYNATKTSELVSGFVNLYKVTNTELKALSKARFVNNEGSTVDYGEFITQLYVLPFTIPNDIIGEKDNIVLGNYDSRIESTLITDSKLYINGGTIAVPNKYNNVYDYLNTTCTLRLPYFNPIIIDVDNVIDKTLTIQFIVDLYSGNCTATITSSFTGEIIHSETTNIVTQIPFIQKQNNSIVNQLSNVNENLIDTPFIEITRNIPYYANNIFGKATIVFDTIGSVTGYCEISDIQLITTATNEEKEEIEIVLKDGIFIKESEV